MQRVRVVICNCNCEVKLLKLKANYNFATGVTDAFTIVIARQNYLN